MTSVDLWSKGLWDNYNDSVEEVILEGWFFFHPVMNVGGVWSLPLPSWVLTGATLLAVPLLGGWLLLAKRASRWEDAGKALVLGGAIGNLYDRLVFEAVRDFIKNCFPPFDNWCWPTYNVADMALVVGIGILVIASWGQPKEAAA